MSSKDLSKQREDGPSRRKRKLNDGSSLPISNDIEQKTTETTLLDLLQSKDNTNLVSNITSINDIRSIISSLDSLINTLKEREMAHESLTFDEKYNNFIEIIDSNYNENGDVEANMCGAQFEIKFALGPNKILLELYGDIKDYEGNVQGSIELYYGKNNTLLHNEDMMSQTLFCDLDKMIDLIGESGLYVLYNNNNNNDNDDGSDLDLSDNDVIKTCLKDLTRVCFKKANEIDKFKHNGMFIMVDQVLQWIDDYSGETNV